MILPPTSEISHHHKVTNITMSPTSLSPFSYGKTLKENDNADNQNGNRSLQIELNGENWLDFQF